eukprot:3729906-Rhodomonas_salina.1
MEVMTDQMHRSTLETSFSALLHAERWSDPVWEDMKTSFSSLRRQHLVCECSHLRRHLRFSLVLRTPEGASDGFLLLNSSLRLTWGKWFLEHLLQVRQAGLTPFPFTTAYLVTELDRLKSKDIHCPDNEEPHHNRNGCQGTTRRRRNCLHLLWMIHMASQGLRLPGLRKPIRNQGGHRLVIRRNRRRLRLSRPSTSPQQPGGIAAEGAVQQPNIALQQDRVEWEAITTLVSQSHRTEWRGKHLFVDGVEATVCGCVQQGSERIDEDAVLLHIPVGTLSIVLFASFKAAKALFHTISSTRASADVVGTTKPIRDLHKLLKQPQSDDAPTGPKGHSRRQGT